MAAVLSESVLDQNGPKWSKYHFGQNYLIPNYISAFARPKWTKTVHFGLFWSILVHLGPPTVLRPFLKNSLLFVRFFSIMSPLVPLSFIADIWGTLCSKLLKKSGSHKTEVALSARILLIRAKEIRKKEHDFRMVQKFAALFNKSLDFF